MTLPYQSIISTLLFCLLFGLSAFFSASETAFMAVNQLKLAIRADRDRRARMVKEAIENPEGLLGTLLICNNFVNISLSSLATSIAIKLAGDAGVIYATLVVTVTLLIIGEILPKTLASYHAEVLAIKVVPVIRVLMMVFTPVLQILRWMINLIVKSFGWGKKDEPVITEEELEQLIGIESDPALGGVIPKEKQDMLLGVFLLDKTILRDIMVPWRDVVSLPADASRDTVIETIAKTNFSRYPVYEGDPTNVIGFVHVRDILLKACNDPFSLREILRPPPFAPDLRTIRLQLEFFKKERTHIAFVVDEYGNIVGLVTLEDILEEIVGDIEDEYDVQQDRIIPLKDGSWLIDGKALIRDVNRAIDLDLPEKDVRTIGGLILRQLQRIPELGEIVTIGKVRLQVVSLRGRRIEKVRVSV